MPSSRPALYVRLETAEVQGGMKGGATRLGDFLLEDDLRTHKLAVLVLTFFLLPSAYGASMFGDIHGAIRNSQGLPVPGAQVIAHSVDENTDLSALSAADGTYRIDKVKPGRYQLTARKDGFAISPATGLQLAAQQSLAADVVLASVKGSDGTSDPARSPAVAENSANAPLTDREKLLLERVDQLERRLAALEGKESSQTKSATATSAPAPSVASLNPAAALPSAKPLTPTPIAGPAPAAAQPPRPAAPPAPALPEALSAPEASTGVDNFTPFAYGDFTWLNGTSRNKDAVLDTKFFTPEIRFDTHFMESFNQPKDHTLGGATESFRSGEFQVEQASVGGDFHWQNVRGRILFMQGLFATTTPRNDASAGVGQWDIRGAYKYVSEAYGGYHFNVNHGLNVDAGIFVSYIGLFSYYNFDNWTYQPSYVSSNTPWFFNGLRIQWFPTNKLKIEPWIINGWQSYNEFNHHRGLGGQILWRPYEWLSFVFNNYGNGTDTLGNPGRSRLHTDDSIEVRYYNKPESTGITKMAFSFTGDLGCEYGGGVSCTGNHKGGPKQDFAGWMAYNRVWWGKDQYAITYGGGRLNNPGRYLTLLPPINGADAISGSPYFTGNPGDPSHMWDTTLTFQWMPREYVTWWVEAGYRHADIPYFSGRGGITPPGGNNGVPTQFACMTGAPSGATDLPTAQINCGGASNVWFPDLRKSQGAISAGVMVKF